MKLRKLDTFSRRIKIPGKSSPHRRRRDAPELAAHIGVHGRRQRSLSYTRAPQQLSHAAAAEAGESGGGGGTLWCVTTAPCPRPATALPGRDSQQQAVALQLGPGVAPVFQAILLCNQLPAPGPAPCPQRRVESGGVTNPPVTAAPPCRAGRGQEAARPRPGAPVEPVDRHRGRLHRRARLLPLPSLFLAV